MGVCYVSRDRHHVDVMGGGWGTVTLKSPGGTSLNFKYKYLGAGPSVGIKNFSSGTYGPTSSTQDSFSSGKVYMLSSFPGAELRSEDIEGICQIVDASAIGFLGVSATVMLLGMSLKSVVLGAVETAVVDTGKNLVRKAILGPLSTTEWIARNVWHFLHSDPSSIIPDWDRATALLVMGGTTSGLVVSAGVSRSVGYLSTRDVELPTFDMRVPVDEPATRTRNTAYETTLQLPADVLFAFDKDNLSPAAVPILTKAGNQIKSQPGSFVVVKGHTDDVGTDAHNNALSKRRAIHVSQWLVSRGYLDSAHVQSIGLGKTQPAVLQFDDAGRKRNRRVEITIFARERLNFNPR